MKQLSNGVMVEPYRPRLDYELYMKKVAMLRSSETKNLGLSALIIY